jgi:hypothetical protein
MYMQHRSKSLVDTAALSKKYKCDINKIIRAWKNGKNDFELSKDSVNMEATAEFKSLRSGVPANIGVDIGDSEEKIIDIYENAKKEGDKYIVISEEREITFIVKEGKVTEIILR